jgi:peptidoglycan/xylan/chitin deacetylase (PgdA/CDA1 family)
MNFIEILQLRWDGPDCIMDLRLQYGTASWQDSLKIDREMYDILDKLIPVTGGKERYRLSRLFTRVPDSDQWIGSLSMTYLEESQTIRFPCKETFVKQVYLAHGAIRKPATPPAPTPSFYSPGEGNKKRSLFSKRTGFFSILILLGLVVTAWASNPLAGTEAAAQNVDAEIDEPAYGSEVFPEFEDSQEAFFQLAAPRETPDPKSVRIQELIQLPDVDGTLPSEWLNDPKNRFLPSNAIALTFDDGPSEYTQRIADILTSYGVGGTFFFLGENIPENQYLVRYVHHQGFSVGNHSYTHPYFKGLSKDRQWEEVQRTNALLVSITGESPTLFRPPYGAMNQTTFGLMVEKNMKIVLWSKDTEDWKVQNAQELVEYTKNQVSGGSIVLFHEKERTVEALPQIIEYLQSQGLEIVSLR